ncbi:MAG: alpha/beta family hydrolase [Gammaproteobacteria bacterium]
MLGEMLSSNPMRTSTILPIISIVVCIAHRACRYSRHNLRFFAGIWIGLRRTGPPGHDGEPEDRRPAVDDARRVRGLLQAPEGARVCYVLAHGAGAGMSHAFMAAIANGLAKRGIATMSRNARCTSCLDRERGLV